MDVYLNIDKSVKDENMIKIAKKLIEDHYYHWCEYKSIHKTQKYELKVQPHSKLKQDVYLIYMINLIGAVPILVFDDETNIYRYNSLTKLGNINKKEYLFVEGKISNYYG